MSQAKEGKAPLAAVWAFFCITFWVAIPVLLMWRLLPRETASTYWVAGILGVNLISFYLFSWLAADPRGGWHLWWQRERREGNSDAAIAALVFALALLWAFMGVFIAKLSWKERDRLTDQLNREDARWLKANGNHA
jgi:hypothetical protein